MNNQEDIYTKYPKLDNLFGSYFHQDFNLDYGSPQGTVADYVKPRSKVEILQIIAEIDAILKDTSIKDLRQMILEGFGCCYSFYVDHPTPEAFLKKIKKQLESYLKPNKKKIVLTKQRPLRVKKRKIAVSKNK